VSCRVSSREDLARFLHCTLAFASTTEPGVSGHTNLCAKVCAAVSLLLLVAGTPAAFAAQLEACSSTQIYRPAVVHLPLDCRTRGCPRLWSTLRARPWSGCAGQMASEVRA
jgi:hypothetical protein